MLKKSKILEAVQTIAEGSDENLTRFEINSFIDKPSMFKKGAVKKTVIQIEFSEVIS